MNVEDAVRRAAAAGPGYPTDLATIARRGINNKVEITSGDTYLSEMLPDGRIVEHRFGASATDWPEAFVPLPDGRFVVQRTLNIHPGKARDPNHPDGPSNPDIRTRLQILDGKEKVRLSHEIRRPGEYVQLLGATAKVAYLARPQGIMRHDFASGHETLVVPTRTIGRDLSESAGYVRVSLEGNLLAVAQGDLGQPWSVDLFDLTTGAKVSTLSLTRVDAIWAGPLRISPDGRHLAVHYLTGHSDSRLLMVDTATMLIVKDLSLVDPADPYATMSRMDTDERLRAMAWSDDRTVRIAWAQLPPNPHGKYFFNDLTKLRTFGLD